MTEKHTHIIEYDDGDFEFFIARSEHQAKEIAQKLAEEHFWFEHESSILRSRYRIFQESENRQEYGSQEG